MDQNYQEDETCTWSSILFGCEADFVVEYHLTFVILNTNKKTFAKISTYVMNTKSLKQPLSNIWHPGLHFK